MNLPPAMSGVQLALRAPRCGCGRFVYCNCASAETRIPNLCIPRLAAVIVTDLVPSQSQQLGLRRLLATVLGAICGATLSPILVPSPWGIGIGVLVAMLTSQLFRARDAAKVAGYICGIVVLDHSVEPWHYAFYRLIETALGVVVAWLISYVPKLIRIEESGKEDAQER